MGHYIRRNSKYNRDNLQRRLVNVAEKISTGSLARDISGARGENDFNKCVDNALSVVFGHKNSQGHIKQGTRLFFTKIDGKDTLPFVTNGEEIAGCLGKLEAEAPFKEAVSLVLRALYNTNDSAFVLELLETFVEMQEASPRNATIFSSKALITAEKYPEYSLDMVSAFRGHEFLTALRKLEGNVLFGSEFERFAWKLGSESGDRKMMEAVSKVINRFFSEKRERITADFMGYAEIMWDRSKNPLAIRNMSSCAEWMLDKEGDPGVSKFLAYADGLSAKIDFSEGGKEGLFFLLAMEVAEGGGGDWFSKVILDLEREGGLVEFCGENDEKIKDYRKEIEGKGFDVGFLENFLSMPEAEPAPKRKNAPRATKPLHPLPSPRQEWGQEEAERMAHRALVERASIPPQPQRAGEAERIEVAEKAGGKYAAVREVPFRKRQHTPRFEEMSEEDRMTRGFYLLSAKLGKAYERKLGEAQQGGWDDMDEFCDHYDELLAAISNIRHSDSMKVRKKEEAIDLGPTFLEYAEILFAGDENGNALDTDLPDAKFAFKVLGEWVAEDLGSAVVEGFMEKVMGVHDSGALVGICSYNRPAQDGDGIGSMGFGEPGPLDGNGGRRQ